MKTTITLLSVDAYIADFPEDIQNILQQIRSTVKKAAPAAAETIKYAIPTFTLDGNLVHFAAYKNHIGLYPAPTGDEAFEKEIAPYKSGKSSLQFPLNKQIPLKLITKIVSLNAKRKKAKTMENK